jgi:hypothetical protein
MPYRRQMLKRDPSCVLARPTPKARQAWSLFPGSNSDLAPPCILGLGDLPQIQVSLCEAWDSEWLGD